MSKYEPLEQFLAAQSGSAIEMSFAQIEELIGDALPASARKHRPWWSNNPSNSVITHAWLNAGFRSAKVDLNKETLVFERAPNQGNKQNANSARHPMFGCMKGTITFHADIDITQPIGEAWNASQ